MSWWSTLRRVNARNLDTLRRSPSAEISGALGDLGTLLPLMMALAIQNSIDLSSTLVFSGLFNIVTGAVFGIPLPVQPMKAIAAASLASQHTPIYTITAAGSLVSFAVLVLSVTGLLRWLTRHIPVPVVKGIQVGAGLSLVTSAASTLIVGLKWIDNDGGRPDNRIMAVFAFLLLIFTTDNNNNSNSDNDNDNSSNNNNTQTGRRDRRFFFPYALAMFLLGIVLALLAVMTRMPRGGSVFGLWNPHLVVPAWLDGAAMSMALAQLPLTTLNSIIAASALAADLFLPDLPSTPSVTELGLSVAGMNLMGCWFGAMPVCHGAGGLAAQHRFGARSGASVMLLGLVKLALGLFFAAEGRLLGLLREFPRSILGVMVIAAGLELAKVGASLNHGAPDLWEEATTAAAAAAAQGDEEEDRGGLGGGKKQHREIGVGEREERWTVMLVTAAGILGFKNDAVGFVAGMLCHWTYRLAEYMEQRRKGREGRDRGLANGETSPLLLS